MSFINEDGLNELRPFTDDFAENDSLFEEEYLKFFELFRQQFAQICATVELPVEKKFTLRCNLPL